MSKAEILNKAEGIFLREFLPEDEDLVLGWMTSGEWRYYDAPWEGIFDSLTEEQEKSFRQNFRKNREMALTHPRKTACICLKDGFPIGRVTRYGNDRFSDVHYLGISICEDGFLERGLGTDALKAWVDYLFQHSEAHKLEVHTWSLNPRMIRVAEKVGFTHEGTERELLQWQGEWQDRLRFGMLREEWEKTSAPG